MNSHHAVKSAGALLASRLAARGVDVVVLILMTRFLVPADFGLMAIAMSVVFIVEAILEMPVGSVTLRLAEITNEHLDTAFTIQLIRSGILVFIMLIMAPVCARFVEEPRIQELIYVLAIAPALRGLVNPKLLIFIQKLDFRREIIVELGGKLTAAVLCLAVAVVYKTYWALAVATISSPAISTIISYMIAPYVPKLSLWHWKYYVNFVGWNFVTQVLSSLSWQIDKILLGRFVSDSDVGRYSIASDVVNFPTQAVLTPLARPATTKMFGLSNDAGQVGGIYLRLSNAMTLVGAPAYGGLIVLADVLVRSMLGPQWSGSAEFIRAFAIAAIIAVPTREWGAVALALGRPDLIAKLVAFELITKLPILILLISLYGAFGGAVTRVYASVITLVIVWGAFHHLFKIKVPLQVRAVYRPLIATLVMMIATHISIQFIENSTTNNIYVLVGAIIIGAVVYFATIYALWIAAGRPAGLEALTRDILSRILSRAIPKT